MPRRLRAIPIVTIALTVFSAPVFSKEIPTATSSAASNERNWKLEDLYTTPDNWTKDYDRLRGEVDKADSCKSTLTSDSATMLSCLEALSLVQKDTQKLYTYAMLKSDENLGIAENTERKTQVQTLATRLSAKTSWVDPAVLAAGKARIDQFRKEQTKLDDVFGFMLDNILRAEPHTLTQEGEEVLAQAGDVLSSASATYEILANAELPFPTAKLSTGEEVRVNQSNYSKYRQAANRDDRKAVFDAFWTKWHDYEGTLGSNLAAHVAGDIFVAQARHYKNSLEAALFADNMPEEVYRTLVTQVNENLPSLHRSFKLRKRMLGISGDMEYFDLYPPLVQLDKKFSVEESKVTTLAALAPLGKEYLDILKQGFSSRWANIDPSQGKASGAYMMGAAYDAHPFLLLNHNDDYESMTTWAHEWGHAVHTVLTRRNQPFEKSNYSTFTAETASILNEMLLQDYMVAHARSKEEKLYYLGMALESMRGTWFRQTMFAEFELKIHEEAEAGRPLSGARMTAMYCDLLKRYHGDAEGVVKINPNYCIEWAFIPHFYYNFYVYQYATSITGAALLAERIESGDPKQRDVFLSLLKAGGSDYPYELYKKAGIDMATAAPYQALVKRMNTIMDQIEALLPRH